MQSFLSYWSVFVLLILGQGVLSSLVKQYYQRVTREEDRRNPDHLPINTGQWVQGRLRAMGLEGQLRVVASNTETLGDSFWPSASVIHLNRKTYFKKDPIYWATGAHELGHVLYWRRSAALAGLFRVARVSSLLTSVAVSLLLVNVVFVEPALTRAAWWSLMLGLGGSAVVLLDEALASLRAMELLRLDGRLTSGELDSARRHLTAAWLTYFGGFAGSAMTLALWGYVVRVLDGAAPMVPGQALSSGWRMCAVILSATMALRCLGVLWRIASPVKLKIDWDKANPIDQTRVRYIRARVEDEARRRSVFDLVWQVVALGFLAVVWDQGQGVSYAVAVALAALSVWDVLMFLALLALLPLLLLFALVRALVIRADEAEEDPEQAAVEADMARERDELERWEAEMGVELVRAFYDPSWTTRLVRLREVAFLPLLIVYWMP